MPSVVPNKPLVGLIGGTGLGQELAARKTGEARTVETPFGAPSGRILRTNWNGVDIAFLARHGDGHLLPPTAVNFRANIWALKSIGCTHVIASGATGSLREEIRPGDLVVPDQLIDRTSRRPGSFFDQHGIAAHVEFSHPFCPHLRRVLLEAADASPASVHDGGTYVCMEGPAFSTVAESRMHRAWGGDLIGMTAMPEARLAREAEICYALVALPTDYDCWRPHDPGKGRVELLNEIMSNMNKVTAHAVELIGAALTRMAAIPPPACDCQTSLDLAVWSDLSRLPSERADALRPILARRLNAMNK